MVYFFSEKNEKRELAGKRKLLFKDKKTAIISISAYKTGSQEKAYPGIIKSRNSPLSSEKIERIGANEIRYTNIFHKLKQCFPRDTSGQYENLLEERIPGIEGITFLEKYVENQTIDNEKLNTILQACLYAFYNLKLIHDKELIHRDVKLDNLMIFPLYNPITRRFEISAEIIDFEYTRHISAEIIADDVGSLPYASPEVYQEPAKQTFQSDVFSAGLCLSDLLNGNHRAVQGVTEDDIVWYQFDFSKTTDLHDDIQKLLRKNDKIDAYSALIRMINIMTQENAEDRGDISTHFETLKNIYKAIYDEDFEPYYIPREKQTKLDKLTKTATRLAGLLYDEHFRTNQWQDFFDVYKDQIARYSQPDKLNSVIPDSDDAYIEKRELFQIIANFVSEHASEQAIQDNICAVTDVLYAIKTSEDLSQLTEKISSIESEALKSDIEPWLLQNTYRTPKI